MYMENEDDYDIVDVENFKGQSDQKYSFQLLIMKAMSKCIEAGAKEMRSGYWNVKSDKFGNLNKVYVPDSRMEFIESVNTLRMLIENLYDEKAKTEIKKVEEDLDSEFKKLCTDEKIYWEKSKANTRRFWWSQGIFYNDKSLNKNLPFYKEFIEFKIDCYRKIFSSIQQLINTAHLFEEEVITITDK